MTAAALAQQHADAWKALHAEASAPYRAGGRFTWHFARGKLGMDPVFRHLLQHGLITPGARVLDIGCGQGLLASLLIAADARAAQGRWPDGWATAPRGAQVTGIELMRKDVDRARAALLGGDASAGAGGGDAARAPRFVCGDMRHTVFPASDVVVMLDVLHYIPIDEQDAVLARVHAALRPGGRLLLRVGDAAARRGFRASQWVDRVVTFVRGHRVTPVFCRPLAAWALRLHTLGFAVDPLPMSQGTPFANVLLVARKPLEATP